MSCALHLTSASASCRHQRCHLLCAHPLQVRPWVWPSTAAMRCTLASAQRRAQCDRLQRAPGRMWMHERNRAAHVRGARCHLLWGCMCAKRSLIHIVVSVEPFVSCVGNARRCVRAARWAAATLRCSTLSSSTSVCRFPPLVHAWSLCAPPSWSP